MSFEVGQTSVFSKTIGECDVYQFAGITGDLNPLHVNAVKAEKMRFGKRIVHGMLTASFISTVIATKVPGPGTIYLEQNLKFVNPVYFGDTITARVTIIELLEHNRAKLNTTIINQEGEIVIAGVALVILPRECAE